MVVWDFWTINSTKVSMDTLVEGTSSFLGGKVMPKTIAQTLLWNRYITNPYNYILVVTLVPPFSWRVTQEMAAVCLWGGHPTIIKINFTIFIYTPENQHGAQNSPNWKGKSSSKSPIVWVRCWFSRLYELGIPRCSNVQTFVVGPMKVQVP